MTQEFKILVSHVPPPPFLKKKIFLTRTVPSLCYLQLLGGTEDYLIANFVHSCDVSMLKNGSILIE